MNKLEKIGAGIVIVSIIALVILINYKATEARREKEELLNHRVTASVIMIQKYKGHHYTIVLNGYSIQNWPKDLINVRIDPYITSTKAEFTPNGKGGYYYGMPIILTFNSEKTAREALSSNHVKFEGNKL